MSGQIFKISGNERRQKKKELSHLKFFVKMFWYFEDQRDWSKFERYQFKKGELIFVCDDGHPNSLYIAT